MIRHQAVSDDMNRSLGNIVAKLPEKVDRVFPFKKNALTVVAAIVEVVIAPWFQVSCVSWHGDAC